MVQLETYHNGVRHGHCERRNHNGTREVGQFKDGKKDGQWLTLDQRGRILRSATFHANWLEGPYVITRVDQPAIHLVFNKSQLTSVNGQSVPLRELMDQKQIDSNRVCDELLSATSAAFIALPLKEVADFFSAKHEVPVVVDPHYGNPIQPVSGEWNGIDLASVLMVFAIEHDHVCDYRYGSIWITSTDDAKDWHDPTGVAEIEPPKDSPLAASWDEPVAIQANQQPLADVLATLAQPLAINIDSSSIEPADETADKYLVTMTLNGHPFRHSLGMLLYKTRCRVELRGETLVILPPK